MESHLVAIHGLLLVNHALEAELLAGETRYLVKDEGLIQFISESSPFIYEIEGSQSDPPLFNFQSTLLVDRQDVENECIRNVVFCASSQEENLDFDFAQWISFNYRKNASPPDDAFSLEPCVNGGGYRIRGRLAFQSLFSKPFAKQAVFVSKAPDGSLREELGFEGKASQNLVSTLLEFDRILRRESHQYKIDTTREALAFFNGRQGSLDEDTSLDQHGSAVVEMRCGIDRLRGGIVGVQEFRAYRGPCIVRWQSAPPSSIRSFLEASALDDQVVEVPYLDGGTGRFPKNASA